MYIIFWGRIFDTLTENHPRYAMISGSINSLRIEYLPVHFRLTCRLPICWFISSPLPNLPGPPSSVSLPKKPYFRNLQTQWACALQFFFKVDKNTKENGVKDLCTLYAIFDKLKYEIFSSKHIYHFNARVFFFIKDLYLWIVLVRMIECI